MEPRIAKEFVFIRGIKNETDLDVLSRCLFALLNSGICGSPIAKRRDFYWRIDHWLHDGIYGKSLRSTDPKEMARGQAPSLNRSLLHNL